jgi:hypothetical protein
MRFKLGRFDFEAGTTRVKRGPLSVPDGLHLWWGKRGVHLFWRKSKYAPRVMWDREE